MQPLVGSAHLLFHSRSLRSAEMGGVRSIVLSLGSFLPHAPLRVHPHRRRAAVPGDSTLASDASATGSSHPAPQAHTLSRGSPSLHTSPSTTPSHVPSAPLPP